MKLIKYEDKFVRVTDESGCVFSGIAVTFPAEL